ncbi:MAG: FUSC family protein, partial [Micromonosporaceae bacterium]|nr:FUSC family protein [Micromonosporaceae bacterium]
MADIPSLVRRRGRAAADAVNRALRRPPQEALALARRRAQPTILTIVRLTVTAVGAFVVARQVTGDGILAPLTALIVVQVTVYQTLRTALQRIASVVIGVLVALALSRALGFTWWSLGIAIAAALAVGYALRLGDSVLEVPISAMLILSLPTETAVEGRIVATLIGAAAGLTSNLLVAPLRVQPAEEAVDDLSRRLADLLDQMAADLEAGRGPQRAGTWVARARALTDEAKRVEGALGQAEESVKLNPRRPLVADPRVYLRARLERLEHATLNVRGIARSLNDSAALPDQSSPIHDPGTAQRIARELRELAGVLRAYGRLALSKSVDREALKAEADRHLAGASERQAEVADSLRSETTPHTPAWPLRGEVLSLLERLRSTLQPAPPRPGRRPPPTESPLRRVIDRTRPLRRRIPA